ncbi:hypothetical protein AXG93_868s1130 [Marchantia polymorpha subsp. ruderalis]|uniref:Uncharacterized protein n=1 Tax=Marchantia polymorpha subsp. ruderalis TaxID=1480154 RepID=A0A176VNB1_MARPO|nr:hypothetical protein AXG93_868s1130 [Marchantia polymorpha subsp. ruderalis]
MEVWRTDKGSQTWWMERQWTEAEMCQGVACRGPGLGWLMVPWLLWRSASDLEVTRARSQGWRINAYNSNLAGLEEESAFSGVCTVEDFSKSGTILHEAMAKPVRREGSRKKRGTTLFCRSGDDL